MHKQLKSPPNNAGVNTHLTQPRASGSTQPTYLIQQPHQQTNGQQVVVSQAYGFNQPNTIASARHSAVSTNQQPVGVSATSSTSQRSNERTEQQYVMPTQNIGPNAGHIIGGAYQNNAANTNYYYGIQAQVYSSEQQQMYPLQHKVKKVAGAIQAYATTVQKSNTNGLTTTNQQRKQSNDQINTLSPPATYSNSSGGSSIVAQLYQQQLHTKKQVINQSAQRYESLQSKLKNKRRVQPAVNNNVIGSTSQLVGQQQQQQNSTKHAQSSDPLKFNHTQKIVTSAFGIGGGSTVGANSGYSSASGVGNLSTNRKQLKLSLDRHSDSSFNNVSIKSADKHNSVVRTAACLLSAKNQNAINAMNVKDLSNQISPSSYNGGGSIQNLASSSSSVYSSHFSNNSRFTNTRPKNPTDSSSLSSKNSDSLSAAGAKNILLDIKKQTGQPKIVSNSYKQSTIQTIKDQQQMLIQHHQQSDSMSDTGEGSFTSNHENNQQQKPLSSKLYTNINSKLQDKVQNSHNVGMKPSNSIANLTKVGSQSQIQIQQNTPGYKSKFHLKDGSKGEVIKKGISSGGDSYRRNSDIQKIEKQTGKQQTGLCGAPFSPKQLQTAQLSIHSKNVPTSKQQILAGLVTQQANNQRNAGGLAIKSSGSLDHNSRGLATGSVGSSNSHQKKSNRDNKQAEQIQLQLANYEANVNFVKPSTTKNQQQSDYAAQANQLQAQAKLNIDQLQTIIRQQQSQHKQIASETIHEERCEDSEQNTKRESTAVNNTKKSTGNLNNESLPNVVQTMNQKSKSLLTINLESTDNLKRIASDLTQSQKVVNETQEAAPPSRVEEIKSNPTLQALKEQLKSQIAKQSHAFSNPNQPSSATEADGFQYPITPTKALKLFVNNLTDYEQTEILDYNEIYFLGLSAQKIKASPSQSHNMGLDDDRGDYQVVIKDHICYRYEVLEFLGKGSFGQAIKCYDYKTNQFVAVKIIRNKKRFHHQAGVELNILTYLKDNDPDDVNNIIRIKDYAIFRKHLVIAFELLSINLYEFIKNNNFLGVSLGLIRRFAIQILQALKYQRDHGIIHCDLKPENILLKQPNKSGIKIIDYGSSCFQNQRIYTYIQSRFYRAPEIVLGIPYTTSIDMWSFGCILAELYTGVPLFPGENEMEQLAYIMEVKNVPEDYLLELSSRRKLFFDTENQPIIVANSRGKKRKPLSKTLKGVLKCQDQNFLNFIDSCLDWDPVNRMTPLEALQHDWILEGLPPKVLLHHQRMFGHRDDKNNIKEATLTQIQGFPPDAETNSIFNLVSKQKAAALNAAISEKKESKNQSKTDFNAHLDCSARSPDQPQVQPMNSSQQASQSSIHGQPKKNKTIQHLVQELFEQKAHQNGRTSSKNNNEGKINENVIADIKARPIEPQIFYNPNHQKISQIQTFKNQTLQLSKVKEADSQYAGGTLHDVPDEDMEEGINFNRTQKIPISLIKQQEKLPVHQVPFYNPKVNGPKLNNYVTQAAAFSKKQHSSTSNLVNRGYQTQNYSATIANNCGTITNSSFNNQQNIQSMSNFNIHPDQSHHMPPSSRSSKNNNQQQPNNVIVPTSIASLNSGQMNSGGASRTIKATQSIKIDLSNSHSERQFEMLSARR